MGLKDLKILKDKEYRLYLWIIIAFIGAFSVCTFIAPIFPQIVWFFYLPLLFVCILLFLMAFLFRIDLKEELTFKRFAKYFIITLILTLIFTSLLVLFFFALLIISILSFIFITSLFTSINLYKKAVNFDDKLYKLPFPFGFVTRTGVLLGGLFIGAILILAFAAIATTWALVSSNIANQFAVLPWILIIMLIILLGIAGFFFFLMGRYNAWLGVYFVWVGIYALYLMIKAFAKAGGSGGSDALPLPLLIVMYVFDLYLILDVIGSLVGKRAQIIADHLEKFPILKRVRPDAIIIWLILSKVAYEFAASFPETQIGAFKAVAVFALYIPLVFLIGLYGMYTYGKTKKRRKEEKKEKKIAKNLKKDIKAGKIDFSESDAKGAGVKTIYCSSCGSPNESTGRFCKICGAELKK